MSLLAFHRGLITVGILFCLGFGSWELFRAVGTDGRGSLLLGLTFLVLGAGLAYYRVRMRRFLGYEAPPEAGSRG